MHRIILALGLALTLGITSQGLMGQSRQNPRGQVRDHVEDLKKRPDLGIDYSAVASFKLATRKAAYRVGEMISIELAMICEAKTPVFFHKLKRPGLVLFARDEKGIGAPIQYYTTVLEGTSPESYSQVEPGRLLFSTFDVIAGCTRDLKAFLQDRSTLNEEAFGRGEAAYFRRVFEGAYFVNWGEACLDIRAAGRYSITEKYNNEMVLVSPTRPRIRTAVGTLRSAPLIVTIIE